jgi:glycosyltransferase involved in cell wall biosynthesis
MPKVSVCIPTYGQPEPFARALESVLDQDLSDFEVVVTDDTRGDEIAAVVRDFGDARVRYLKNDVRRGSPANWNVAVDHAEGEFVKVLHHDDWFASRSSLRKFVALLDDDRDAQLGFSASNACDAEQRLLRIHSPSDHVRSLSEDPRVLLLGNWIGAPSATIYRRAVQTRFDPRLKWVVDIDFYLGILMSCPRFAYCDEALVSVTSGAPHQISSEVEGEARVELFEWFTLYAKWAPWFPFRGEPGAFLDALLARFEMHSWRSYRKLELRGRSARLFIVARMLHRSGLLGGVASTRFGQQIDQPREQ